jgi:hypothetical protein
MACDERAPLSVYFITAAIMGWAGPPAARRLLHVKHEHSVRHDLHAHCAPTVSEALQYEISAVVNVVSRGVQRCSTRERDRDTYDESQDLVPDATRKGVAQTFRRSMDVQRAGRGRQSSAHSRQMP